MATEKKSRGRKKPGDTGEESTIMWKSARKMGSPRSGPRMWVTPVIFNEWQAKGKADHGGRSSG
jgi:hypothetical protein